jgi:PilZ domain-containing protein
MGIERRRSPRYPFAATAEIIDEKENARTSSHVSDLSLQGCYVEVRNPFPQGTSVFVEIYTETEFLEVHAKVAFLKSKAGMGLTFNELQPCFTTVLNKWLGKAATGKTTRSKTLSSA